MQKYLLSIKTSIIYKVLNEDGKNTYYGSTDSIYRLNFHNNGFGKLDLKHKYGDIMYSEIQGVARDELYFIEYYLIQRDTPSQNSDKGNLEEYEITKQRKLELMEIANSLIFDDFK